MERTSHLCKKMHLIHNSLDLIERDLITSSII
jgi:hypothetical protein